MVNAKGLLESTTPREVAVLTVKKYAAPTGPTQLHIPALPSPAGFIPTQFCQEWAGGSFQGKVLLTRSSSIAWNFGPNEVMWQALTDWPGKGAGRGERAYGES